ncbi:hypothetical protein D3C78_1810030 [compost metagenome]
MRQDVGEICISLSLGHKPHANVFVQLSCQAHQVIDITAAAAPCVAPLLQLLENLFVIGDLLFKQRDE